MGYWQVPVAESGYDIQWQVLNAKNFGVPQNRERLFVVGHLRGEPRPQVLPIGEGNGESEEGNRQGTYARTIQTQPARCRGTHIRQLNNPRHSNDRVYSPDGLSPTLNCMGGGNRQPFIKISAMRGRYGDDGKTTQELETRQDGLSNTITSVQKDNLLTESGTIRRLTPLECEKLMGFPGGWTEGMSDTQRYKQCGNAVVPQIITEIVKKL